MLWFTSVLQRQTFLYDNNGLLLTWDHNNTHFGFIFLFFKNVFLVLLLVIPLLIARKYTLLGDFSNLRQNFESVINVPQAAACSCLLSAMRGYLREDSCLSVCCTCQSLLLTSLQLFLWISSCFGQTGPLPNKQLSF